MLFKDSLVFVSQVQLSVEDHYDDLGRWLVSHRHKIHWMHPVLLKYVEVLLH